MYVTKTIQTGLKGTPFEQACEVVRRWCRTKHHSMRPFIALSETEWMTECTACGYEVHINRTEKGYVMNLAEATCTHKEAPADGQEPL
jgi:hypothetical protein